MSDSRSQQGRQMPKIVVPDDCPAVLRSSQAWRRLMELGAPDYYDTLPGSEDRLIERIANANTVINIRSSSKFTDEVFQRCPNLRLVSIWGTGTDNVDLPAAERRGVTVTNTPGVSAVSVAEHALTLMLAVARQISRSDRETRQGLWPRGRMAQLHGKTLGVIGLGAIGRQMARLGTGIGMRVIAWTMHPNPALGFELSPFDELLQTSDVVSLHLRLSDQTRRLIGARELALMKPSAILVNTARGAIVDEPALGEALAGGRIAGAGLDVFESEPLPGGHPLAALENVILTPHLAGVTPEALEAGLQMAVENVHSFLAGRLANVVRPA
jgi:D-3-phosphoglycerate dehydrogenase